MLLAAVLLPLAARADDARVVQRSSGTDVATARRVAAALLARPLAAQLLRVRCERVGRHVDCGLIVSGVKFHRALDMRAWDAEIAALIDGAFAAAPEADEIDCWATVPLERGQGDGGQRRLRQADRRHGLLDHGAARSARARARSLA